MYTILYKAIIQSDNEELETIKPTIVLNASKQDQIKWTKKEQFNLSRPDKNLIIYEDKRVQRGFIGPM